MKNENPEDTSEGRVEEEIEDEEFKDVFPSLFREIKDGEKGIMKEEHRTSAGSKKERRFTGYTPGAIDFICRCKTEQEAEEIIDYLLKKGDITEEYANNLKKQLQEKGLEYFGEHRGPGYYERA
ncbi:MAG: DUF2095 family protein [Candidatus Heimdallarchaeota archaeon]|nr:DUF2095 family protein [Candidatus Heimdallarchaeota archaeon]